jgi:hypothetical protein
MGYGVYDQQGTSTWHRLGRGMIGGQYTTLGLAIVHGPRQTLLAATALGVFRYEQ